MFILTAALLRYEIVLIKTAKRRRAEMLISKEVTMKKLQMNKSTNSWQENSKDLIKGKWSIIQLLTFIVILLLLNTKPIYANESTVQIYSPIVSDGVNAQIKSDISSKTPTLVEISDDYGRQFISKKIGNTVATRLKHRVSAPLAKQLPEVRFTKSITQETDTNWCGYIVQSSNIQGVSGEFNAAPSQNGVVATWTGIGGVNGTGNLAQTGIDQKYMAAWTEIYPAPAQYWFYVNDGDQIISKVLYDSDTGNWYLLIADLTTGYYYHNEFSFNPDQTTAEWIVERATNSNIGTFDTVNFSSAYWYDGSSTKQNINSDADTALYKLIVSWNGQSAVPSSIGSDGQSFSITPGSIFETLTVSNPSITGFTVGLSPALIGLTGSNFILRDNSNNPISIASATTSDNGATYTIGATLTAGQTYTVTASKTGYDFGSTKKVAVPGIPEVLTVSNPSITGFTVGLSPALIGLTGSNFILRDNSNNPISIASATTSDNGATYTIGATLTAGQTYTVTASKTGYDFGSTKNVAVPFIPEVLTVSNPSITGFTVELGPALNGLTVSNFIIRNNFYNLVIIATATTSDSGATYTISTTLLAGQTYTVTASKTGNDFGSPKNVVVPAIISEAFTVSNPSTTGFTIGLSPALNGLTGSNFSLLDSWNEPVNITSAATSDNGATYTIIASLKVGNTYTVTATKVGYTFGTQKNVTLPSGITFGQGTGYQTGAYDLNAAQPSVFNWTRQSQFKGPQNPILKWAFQTRDFVVSSPVVGSDGTVYVVGANNNLLAVNANGSVKWGFSLGSVSEASPAIGADGTIYIGTWQGGLFAINPDGSQKWHFGDSMTNSSTQPVIAGDGKIYFLAQDLNEFKTYLYAINIANGSLIRAISNTRPVLRSPPAIAKDGTVYVGSSAIDPDGGVKWTLPTIYNGFAPAISADGTVYVGYDKLYAIKPDGSIKGAYSIGDGANSSPAIATDGTVYIASSSKIYAVNSDGSNKWVFSTGGIISSTPLIGRDGVVYVGSSDNNIYAINPDGSQKWAYKTNMWVKSSPAIGSDGTLYIGSYDYNLYALADSNVVPISETVTVSNPSTTGFTVGLSPALNGCTKSDFTLFDSSNNPVNIESATTSDNGATYTISATFIADQTYTFTAAKTGYDFGTAQSLIIVDKTTLNSSVNNATTLIGSKSIGIAVGQVPQAAHDTLQAAIDASTVVNNNASATQVQVNEAVTALNAATTNFNLAIIDKPIITLNGSSNVTVQVGSNYNDAGATANDYKGRDITLTIIVTNQVDTSTVGTYTIHYNVKDSNGNTADEVRRTVQVVANQVVNIPIKNRLAGGYGYTLALKSDGTVVGWGQPSSELKNIPLGLNNVVKLATNNNHALALRSDGSVVAWGDNSFGETSVPNDLSGLTEVATGGHHNLVVKSDGTVTAWGWNIFGQTNVPSGLTGVVSVAAGYDFSLALKTDGTVVAWGNNTLGQTSVPTGLNGVIAIAVGEAHCLALKSNGTVVAWGYNSNGESNVPAGLNGVIMIAAEGYHNLALKSDGTVVAWGWNPQGILNSPPGLNGVLAVACGYDYNLALKSDGTVVAWGNNSYGQTNVPSDLSLLPLDVPDTVKPVITINGPSEVTVQVSNIYTDAGATASDNKDGYITSNIITTGNVDTTEAGNYTIRYNVKDSSGNEADEVIRTVHVVTVIVQFTAKPIVQIGINPNDSDSVGIFIGLDNIVDSNGNSINNPNISAYQIELDYDPTKVSIPDVVDETKSGQFSATKDPLGKITINYISETGTSTFNKLLFLPITLTGSAIDTTSLQVKYLNVSDNNHNQISVENPPDLVFQRGKILNEGAGTQPNINDAVAGLQYLAGLKNVGKDSGQVNLINMASILGAGASSNVKPSVKDVIALMQYLVGLRDINFMTTGGSGGGGINPSLQL